MLFVVFCVMCSSLVICMSTMCAFLFMLRATLSSRRFGSRALASVHVACIIVARRARCGFIDDLCFPQGHSMVSAT